MPHVDTVNQVATTQVSSDSNPFAKYDVTYNFGGDGEFRCSCPAFTFRQSDAYTCKHIQRVDLDLIDAVDDALGWNETPEPVLTTDPAAFTLTNESFKQTGDPVEDPRKFVASLNGGPEASFDEDTLVWVLNSISAGDEIVVRRA